MFLSPPCTVYQVNRPEINIFEMNSCIKMKWQKCSEILLVFGIKVKRGEIANN